MINGQFINSNKSKKSSMAINMTSKYAHSSDSTISRQSYIPDIPSEYSSRDHQLPPPPSTKKIPITYDRSSDFSNLDGLIDKIDPK